MLNTVRAMVAELGLLSFAIVPVDLIDPANEADVSRNEF